MLLHERILLHRRVVSRKKTARCLEFLLPSATWRKEGWFCEEQVRGGEGHGIKRIFSPILPTESVR